MYFDEPRESTAPLAVRPVMGTVLSLNGISLLVFGILPGGLMAICVGAVTSLIPG